MDDLQRLVDRTDIVERKCAFARAADARDADRMIAFFTPDCVATYLPGTPALGRSELYAWYSGMLGPVVASSHHLSNFEVDFAGDDTATLRCYLYSWQRYAGYPGTPDKHRWGRYRDTWVRTANGWLQSSLELFVAGEQTEEAVDRTGEYLAAGF